MHHVQLPVFLSVLWSGTVPHSCFVFYDIDILEKCSSVFFIKHFSLGISLIFIHDLMEVMHFSARGLQKCFMHPIKEHMMSVCPTAGVNFDYLTP